MWTEDQDLMCKFFNIFASIVIPLILIFLIVLIGMMGSGVYHAITGTANEQECCMKMECRRHGVRSGGIPAGGAAVFHAVRGLGHGR